MRFRDLNCCGEKDYFWGGGWGKKMLEGGGGKNCKRRFCPRKVFFFLNMVEEGNKIKGETLGRLSRQKLRNTNFLSVL